MALVDYNGQGRWAAESIASRYREYAVRFRIERPLTLAPEVHDERGRRWVFPIMVSVISGIEAGDLACAEIGVEFIEESSSFSFGRILKSNAARALRRAAALTDGQQERIRRRVVEMLVSEYLPREFRQYAKLARKVDISDQLREARSALNFGNPWVSHYFELLTGEERA